MIFTLFSVAARERTLQAPVSVLVTSSLNSIITVQIADLEGLCKAAELKADNLNAILKDPRPQNSGLSLYSFLFEIVNIFSVEIYATLPYLITSLVLQNLHSSF